MLEERRLRKHLAQLVEVNQLPCDCARKGHGRECQLGDALVVGMIEMLRWVLGDNPQYDHCEEHCAEVVASLARTVKTPRRRGRRRRR